MWVIPAVHTGSGQHRGSEAFIVKSRHGYSAQSIHACFCSGVDIKLIARAGGGGEHLQQLLYCQLLGLHCLF